MLAFYDLLVANEGASLAYETRPGGSTDLISYIVPRLPHKLAMHAVGLCCTSIRRSNADRRRRCRRRRARGGPRVIPDGVGKANFKFVRGAFRFNSNQYPVHNLYLRVVQKGVSGKIANNARERRLGRSRGSICGRLHVEMTGEPLESRRVSSRSQEYALGVETNRSIGIE
jgi:hypothetical protein